MPDNREIAIVHMAQKAPQRIVNLGEWEFVCFVNIRCYFICLMSRLEAWKKIDNLARANPDIHKLTSLMKECTFMEIENVDNVNAVSNETTDNDKILMN